MKTSCCPILAVLVLIVISLQLWTIKQIKEINVPSPVPVAFATPSPTIAPNPSLSPSSTPTSTPSTDSTLLFKRDNPGACSFTDTSKFTLDSAHTITKLQTWYSWNSNEITLDYQLKQGEKIVREGVLVRKDCDPYQRQWCQAVEENLNLSLEKGDYALIADTKKICQNSTSGGEGFIFVYGK